MRLKDKVVLITGGASGIGRATALLAAQEGARVVVSDVDEEGGDETVAMIRDNGGAGHFVKADVSNNVHVAALVKAALDAFGRLDCAVNNAGITGNMLSRLADIDEEVFDRILSVNVKGVWLCMKHELPIMVEQGGGAIVNVASVAGLRVQPKDAAYTASKHAVIGLTKSAAIEYARYGIRVNAVCPGYTDTPMVQGAIEHNEQMRQLTVAAIPLKRLGRPEEIAEGIVWLCSDAASFVTGHGLVLDGGIMAT
ncbi:MAG: SDR family oxidoreductase [Chloroflexi bacterium]|nr:MAG: SDR family oxidoreductase [Chloroflexota bacterium]